MNHDDRTDPIASHIELEDSLRTLRPRSARLDVEAIYAASVNRVPSPIPSPANAVVLWVTVGGASAVSALISAAVVFALLRAQILDLQEEVVSLSQQQVISTVASDMDGSAEHFGSAKLEAKGPQGGTVPPGYAFRLPLLRVDEFSRESLSVGSHLNRVVHRLSRKTRTTGMEPVEQRAETLDRTLEQRRPVTRATLIEDLLDT